MFAPVPGSLRVTRTGIAIEARESIQQQPAEPDALSCAAGTDAVHAVVPVAGTDQRQARLTGQSQTLVQASCTVLE